ncbi:Dockerin domain-containing protein [Candidatus Magnetomoraceae bacterium gMMP-15]
MKSTTKICSVILAVMMLLSGIPFFINEDVSRDRNVDLQDVILVIRGVAQTADSSIGFKAEIKRALSVLNVVAGLKSVIKPAKDSNASSTFLFHDFPFILSSFQIVPPADNTFYIYESLIHYNSLTILPEVPPPRIAEIFV